MTHLVTSTLSSKAQLTLPKEVRALLGLKSKGELVGFLIDPELGSVRLSRVDAVPVQADFEKEEYRKLLKLRGGKGGKSFRRMSALLSELKD